MKILYVGDNRDRVNWGCRATSMALGEVLQSVGGISSAISGKEVGPYSMTPIPWGGMAPTFFWRNFDRFTERLKWEISKHAKSTLKICDDFINEDVNKSLENFYRIRRRFGVLQRIYLDILSADIVVINGEGSYIFTDPPRRDALFYNFIIKLSHDIGKKTYLVNAMFSDCPMIGRNDRTFFDSLDIFREGTIISTRDKLSHEYLAAANEGLEDSRYIPDALFTWSKFQTQWDNVRLGKSSYIQPYGYETYENLPDVCFDKPYICLSGSSSAAWDPVSARKAYAKLAKSLKRLGHQVLITPTCSGDAFLYDVAYELKLPYLPPDTPVKLCAIIVGNAVAYVTGRFHPAILASIGGTPCVFMASNSHKTESLQSMLEYDEISEFSDIPSDVEIEGITEKTSDVIVSKSRSEIVDISRRRGKEAQELIELFSQDNI